MDTSTIWFLKRLTRPLRCNCTMFFWLLKVCIHLTSRNWWNKAKTTEELKDQVKSKAFWTWEKKTWVGSPHGWNWTLATSTLTTINFVKPSCKHTPLPRKLKLLKTLLSRQWLPSKTTVPTRPIIQLKFSIWRESSFTWCSLLKEQTILASLKLWDKRFGSLFGCTDKEMDKSLSCFKWKRKLNNRKEILSHKKC